MRHDLVSNLIDLCLSLNSTNFTGFCLIMIKADGEGRTMALKLGLVSKVIN